MPKNRAQDEEEVEATEEAMPERSAKAEPSLDGLVKMKKDDRIIHAHPTTIKDHQRNGWKEV